jgi:Actin
MFSLIAGPPTSLKCELNKRAGKPGQQRRRLGACLAIGRGLDLVMASSTELTSDVPLAIFTLPLLSQPSIPPNLSYDLHRSAHTPLVIDNGSTNLRFGFATSTTPQVIPNIVSKYKERRAGRQLLLFGDAIDTEGGARSQAKTPWEGDVLLNFDALVSTA